MVCVCVFVGARVCVGARLPATACIYAQISVWQGFQTWCACLPPRQYPCVDLHRQGSVQRSWSLVFAEPRRQLLTVLAAMRLWFMDLSPRGFVMLGVLVCTLLLAMGRVVLAESAHMEWCCIVLIEHARTVAAQSTQQTRLPPPKLSSSSAKYPGQVRTLPDWENVVSSSGF